MHRWLTSLVLIGLIVTVAGCGGGHEETLMTEYADVPASVGKVKARVEDYVRERNGPYAADCRRSADGAAGSAGHQVWECKVITDSGRRANLKLLVDPSDGSYSILRCEAPQGPSDLCEGID
jgi:hypothetical protein